MLDLIALPFLFKKKMPLVSKGLYLQSFSDYVKKIGNDEWQAI